MIWQHWEIIILVIVFLLDLRHIFIVIEVLTTSAVIFYSYNFYWDIRSTICNPFDATNLLSKRTACGTPRVWRSDSSCDSLVWYFFHTARGGRRHSLSLFRGGCLISVIYCCCMRFSSIALWIFFTENTKYGAIDSIIGSYTKVLHVRIFVRYMFEEMFY